ncbi:MAG: hypothetical protein ACYS0G_14135, partial [Planctomycetota bacterium]
MTWLRNRTGGSLLLVGFAVCAMTTGAVASEQGMAAADEVSEASYYDLLYNWLYTHAGDNRGFGAEH